jgi:4a-hydroxytetrahydrobiopterin dehydratase
MNRPSRLDDLAITTHLQALHGWSRAGNAITRTFTFTGFPQAVAFVQRVVEPAESLNHHPDVDLRYNRVIVTCVTHDQGGLTELDFALAAAVERAAAGV